jgi:hypothetical protein
LPLFLLLSLLFLSFAAWIHIFSILNQDRRE